jgi:proteasome lid subunit RPN8/RPN11
LKFGEFLVDRERNFEFWISCQFQMSLMLCPWALIADFITVASRDYPNETLGVLFCPRRPKIGSSSGQTTTTTTTTSAAELQATTIIIPKQSQQTMFCPAEDDRKYIQFVKDDSLRVLGWVHTHPNFATTLSTVDEHTHASMMLSENKEAVCIVYSHRHGCRGTDVFSLSQLGYRTAIDCGRKRGKRSAAEACATPHFSTPMPSCTIICSASSPEKRGKKFGVRF